MSHPTTRPAVTLYLAGPMSGLPDDNYPAFHAATAQLRAAGYTVINPAENGQPYHAALTDHMRANITNLCRSATAVALLPGWRDSQGARLERHIASQLGMPCLPAHMWIDLAHALRAGG